MTVVEDRPIMSVYHCLPVLVFYFWRKLYRTLQRGLSAIAEHLVTLGSKNICSVVPSSDTTTDTMTDFEKVDRVRRRARLIPVSSGFQVGHTRDRSESVFSIVETSVFEFHF